MPDWKKSMTRSYEFYVVDPGTWSDKTEIKNVKSCTINRDLDSETLGSATLDITDSLSECYVRIYMITIQNGVREKFPLGTFLVQTPSSKFDGRSHSSSIDAYTPLIELKEKPLPIGYYIEKDTNIMTSAYMIAREQTRAPVVASNSDKVLPDDYIANSNDTWVSFLRDMIGTIKYRFDLDERGRILFAPKQDVDSLQPVWTFDDGNSSILYPAVSINRDLYGIPNVIEVVYSNSRYNYYHRVVNNDPNSPVSVQNRGREIIKRVTDLGLPGVPSERQVQEVAEQLLRELSKVKFSITYTHAYCPARPGDCVRLNYTRAGLTDVKAQIINQSIKCDPGCPVTETAIFTKNLWG